jgi:two-component system, OmpR family, phosphate regulon response regulator OmpR
MNSPLPKTPENAPKGRIVVVDDEPDLRALLQRYLSENGYSVRTVPDGAQLDRMLARETYDVIVLDLMLPGEDGLSICRRLRAAAENIPILMLTARDDPIDRVLGLEMGADDYLAKPFNPRELLARIQALQRRATVLNAPAAGAMSSRFSFGPYQLDLGARQLKRAHEPVVLTSGEFSLLRSLVTHAGRPLSRERLMELSDEQGGRSRERDAFDRSIDVLVVRIRKLIEADPAKPEYIKTVWGVGYVFNSAAVTRHDA